MTSPIRLLAVDVDGTLMDSHNRLPASHRDALRRAHEGGLKICLCTGRCLNETRDVLAELDLALDAGVFVFGAIVCDLPGGRTTSRAAMPMPLAARVIQLFQSLGHPVLLLHDAAECGFDYQLVAGEKNPAAYERWLSQVKTQVRRVDRWVPGGPEVVRAGVIEEARELDRTLEVLTGAFPPGEIKFNAIYAPNYRVHVVECFAPEVNKWAGIRGLLQRWGIAEAQVAAIGDDVNDLEMIRHAGLGIAMGNGIEAVKSAARWCVPANDAGGLAVAVDALLEGRALLTSSCDRDSGER